MNIVRFAVVGLSLALLPGCASLALVQGPQPVGHPDREASSQTCTTSKQWVALDGVVGGVLVVAAGAALVDADNFNKWSPFKAGAVAPVGALLAGVAGWSAKRGNTKVNECRELRLQLGGPQQAAPDGSRSADRWFRTTMSDLAVVPGILKRPNRPTDSN